MVAKRVTVYLSDKQAKFLEWLADRDGVTVNKELEMMLCTEFNECEQYFEEEYKGGTHNEA